MTFNEAGRKLLRRFESCRLAAYDDATGKELAPREQPQGTATIGWGHTGPEVRAGLKWTQPQADAQFEADVLDAIERVEPLIERHLTDNQFSALVCLAFNIGMGNFAGSSALDRANLGHFSEVPAKISLWNKTHVRGRLVISRGLKRRRAAEVRLWLAK